MGQAWQSPDLAVYCSYLADSFKRFTGQPLIPQTDQLLERLYHAPFALVSHGLGADPLFIYANETAQELWGMEWDEMIGMPSRQTAEADEQEERARLLTAVEQQGYIDDYQGIRVTRFGERFRIQNCVVWNVVDGKNQRLGQAAKIDRWEWL
ncbi:MAG: MEKHLA domain-containing protein [Rickettsiales bacterium]|nr:MEKHLA domain-containing protein [Rickettsiales bacterium]